MGNKEQSREGKLSLNQWRDAYIKHAPAIGRFIARRVLNAQDTEDLTQRVFMRVGETSYEERGYGIRPWLYTTARHLVIDHFRSLHPGDELTDDMTKNSQAMRDQPNEDMHINAISARVLLKRIDEMLEGPDSQLLTLLLQETPRTEIATILNISPGTARKRVHDLHERIRRIFDEDGYKMDLSNQSNNSN